MDIALDSKTGDLEISNGDLFINEGVEAVRQNLEIALQVFKGEWFLDEDLGIPYLGNILGKKRVSDTTVISLVRKAIKEVPNVSRILKLEFDLDTATRALLLSIVVQAFGQTISTEQTISV